ncbi:hypothetical protein [Aphanothece sacrum]|uniref:Uncharacterized protein n=1 Tax=Aphanothece sacrum FPU1 TaxID=1920663 RepID=A0A401IFV0_APHSA|nr:hypothetical protein [Aphanothece sacrum]GBF80096.1 hypothetical protein AsFPU1_1497 [Aphanothece sacrum FPU1]GBF86066.1 hypothetical protein AsFPU3_3136 [Aphanothece sacrum FPU3]
MENITIQVDPEIAQAYRDADPEQQQKISIFLNAMLKKAVNKKPFLEIMQEASKPAITNRMTLEIIESFFTSGQIPIPPEIKEKLGLYPSMEMYLEIIGNLIQLRKESTPSRGTQLIAAMRGKTTSNLSTDTIMQMTRDSE